MPSTILSDNGVTSGTSGIKTTGSNDGTLALQTTTAGGAATTALSISTAQVVTLTNALPVASGGSGVTTSTGTGANVLGTSPTITTPVISSLSSASATALTLQSAGTTAITVNTSQNVGVGTTSPNGFSLSIGKLVDIAGTGTGGATPSQLSIYNAATTNGNITARMVLGTSGASSNGDGIIFDATNDGTVTTNANQYLTISTRASGTSAERVRVNAFGLGLGGAIPTSGTGVSFPATINASSDANTLDDYEEGTWTPVVTSGVGSITSYTATGSYTKIGRTVTLYGNVQITNPGSAGGDLRMNSVPFNTLLSGQYLGVCRETTATGIIYYPNITGSQLSIQSSTNGAVAWSTNYRYETINTYTTT